MEKKMSIDASVSGKPWQNTSAGFKNKLNALFNEGFFSDLTICFPGKETKFKAHKAILSMSSPVFERMLFGPMAITGSELELHNENLEAFKILLAHCYGVLLKPSNMDEALDVYMLADQYYMEELSRECSEYISNFFNSDNIEKVLEFSNNFNFSPLKETCFDHLKYSAPSLLTLSQEWLNILEKEELDIEELSFKESWRNPNKMLDDTALITILTSKIFSSGLYYFSGGVSAKIVRNICSNFCWDNYEGGIFPELKVSFTNIQQANEIICHLTDIKYKGSLSIHLQCDMIPADMLRKLPVYPEVPDIFLSNVDDNGITWAVTAIKSLKPEDILFSNICFPRSKLSLRGIKILLRRISCFFDDNSRTNIKICSSNVPSNQKHKLTQWTDYNSKLFPKMSMGMLLKLYDQNKDIDYW